MGRLSPLQLSIGVGVAGGVVLAVLVAFLAAGPVHADGGGPSPTPLPTQTITLLPTLTSTLPYPYPPSFQNTPLVTPTNVNPPPATGFACWPLAILLIVVVIIFSSWRMGGARRA